MRTRILACVAGLTMVATLAMAQKKVPKKEYDAFMAIQNATTADARIAAVDAFVTGFADSTLKSTALELAAEAARSKNDSAKAIVYAQSALEADPKNYDAMLLISGEISRGTRENDLDKEEKLARAEKLAREAMETVKAAAKPNPQAPDEQWNNFKKDTIAQANEDLGLASLARKKYDDAVGHFKDAVDTAATPNATTMVRLAAAYDQDGKPDEGIAELDKVLAMPNLNPAVKSFATAEKARAQQLKNAKK